MVSVEDVHWIDATSEALLESLAESLGGTAMLLVATYRAGYRPPWMNTSYATQVALPPLSPHDSRHVVRAVMGSHVMPESVTEQLLKRAEGNPFFLEELSRVALVPGAPAVPDTVHAVLQTRIDRLSDVPRQLLQTAAVIGREVPKTLLQATGQAVESLAGLDELKHSEFLHERPSASGPVYVFKHALTQEVAYASCGRARTGKPGGSDEIVAYHLVRAHEWGAALPHLLKAGERAAQALSTREAPGFYDEAAAVAERLGAAVEPVTWLAIYEARASLYGGLSDFRRAHAEGARAVAMAQRVGDRVREGEALVAMALASMFLSDWPQAIADARQGLDVATAASIPKVAARISALTGGPREAAPKAWSRARGNGAAATGGQSRGSRSRGTAATRPRLWPARPRTGDPSCAASVA